MWSWLGVTSTSESMSSPLSVDNMLENNFDVEEPSTDIELKTRQKNIKIVLCGDPGGGKTSLIERYDTKKFRLDTKTTVGADFLSKEITLGEEVCKANIFDTAGLLKFKSFKCKGQPNFRHITNAFYQGANGVILVYDMTFEKTFNSLHSWLQEIKKHAPSNVIIYLVGNKTDLVEKRVVTQYQANELIKKISVKYFETSAKDGTNVERVFNDLLNEIHAQWQ